MADKFTTTPTYNPAAKDNLGLALQHLVKYVSTNLECSIPAKIVKYNRTTHVATVQPLVKIQYPDGDQVKSEERQQFDVTVLQFCHGGFVIDIPLSEGDTGWVVASDRDAVLAKRANANIRAADNKGAQDPNTSQKHRYNLGFFIPDSWATIPYDMEKFNGKMVIGDVENIDDPAAYITLDHDGHIVIHADKEVIFESELITFDCNVHIRKNLEVDGDSVLHENLKVEGKDNKINDMTEQEIKFFSDVVKKDGKTYLVLSKTNILRSDPEKVDEIEFEGGSGGAPIEDAAAQAETLDAGSDATALVEWDDESKTLNFSLGIPRGPKGDKGEDGENGADGVGIGEVVLKSTDGKKKTYSVMSDEATPRELGTFEVNDGTGIGEVRLKSTSGRSKTYSIMSDDVPAVELGTFTVLDGADGSSGQDGDTILSISSGTPTVSDENTITPVTVTMSKSGQKNFTVTAKNGSSGSPDKDFSWEGNVVAKVAATAAISIDSKTIIGANGITVTEANRVITISGGGSQIAGYTTPEGTFDYEVTGQEWDSTNHRIVIHKVKKTYENGLLKTREAIADEYIQFVEETV